MRKFFLSLSVLATICLGLAQPAAAQYYGPGTYLTDPSGTCTYPGRTTCPFTTQTQLEVPYGATQEIGASGVVTAATAAATIPKAALKTTYLQGIFFTSGGATGASLVTCTITGLLGGTVSFIVPVVAGATLGNVPVNKEFKPPLPSSAANVDIVVSCPTLGAGNNGASMIAYGYIQ